MCDIKTYLLKENLKENKMNKKDSNDWPVIIGVGEYTNRPKDHSQALNVYDLIYTAIKKAANDSNIRNILKGVDTLFMVNSFSLNDDDPPGKLSQIANLNPKKKAYTWIGASAPQWYVNQLRERLLSGKSKIGLICGGEALYSKKLINKANKTASNRWDFPAKHPWMAGDLRDPVSERELKYGLMLPLHIYPLFENALRYSEGLSVSEHKNELAYFCASMSSVAEKNPNSWFRVKRKVEEILDPSDQGRVVAWPYTKLMCSIMEVDQAAALLMTTAKTAKELGVPGEKWIYQLGGGDAYDIWYVSERINFHESPSVRAASSKALKEANLSISDINYFDLYSCFPCAIRMTRNMLGISKNDPRPLTVTGGMPYFGGPGNNYALHSICQMVKKLRKNPTDYGLVQALSWFISKHSVGIYSGKPGKSPCKILSNTSYQTELDKLKGPKILDEASGPATVETFTIFHDKCGQPVNCVIIGRNEDNHRFISKFQANSSELSSIAELEIIGEKGNVHVENRMNIFKI